MSLHIIILAAGLGKRMSSVTPKLLHQVGGRSMIVHSIQTAQSLCPDSIHVVIGHAKEQIRAACSDRDIHWVEQGAQLGTGHAVMQVLPHIPDAADVLILCADTPLLRPESLQTLLQAYQSSGVGQTLALLLTTVPNPHGLGRILRNSQGDIVAIVEEKDADHQQRLIREIYTGICCTTAKHLKRWLPQLTQNNIQAEYYLTEIVTIASAEVCSIVGVEVGDYQEVMGVNDRVQLHEAERIWQRRMAYQLLASGVSLADAHRIDIRGDLRCGQDVFIDVNTIFIGQVVIGAATVIQANCVLSNVTIGAGCTVFASSVLEDCVIGDACQIGPFARIRPGTELASHCKIGNFVETKQAVFGHHSKANHLSYLGDVHIGAEVNIGAGTITCNYDGANKHQTTIEEGVHIGSGSQLVAPVTIGKNATIGAGSTIRTNVPPHALTLTGSKQKTIHGWQRPIKDNKEE